MVVTIRFADSAILGANRTTVSWWNDLAPVSWIQYHQARLIHGYYVLMVKHTWYVISTSSTYWYIILYILHICVQTNRWYQHRMTVTYFIKHMVLVGQLSQNGLIPMEWPDHTNRQCYFVIRNPTIVIIGNLFVMFDDVW